MKRIIKNPVMMYILGIITCTLTTVLASSLLASDITYKPKDPSWKVLNVGQALDDLKVSENKTHFSSEFLSGNIFGIYESSNTNVMAWNGATKSNGIVNMAKTNALYSIAGINIPTGCYFVLVNGENLDNKLAFDAVDQNDTSFVVHPILPSQSSHYAYYYLNITKNIASGEFRIWNKSDNSTKVKTTIIFNAEACPKN